jgi:nitroreductase
MTGARAAGGRHRLTMPLEKAMRTQRAIRRLKPDPVDDDLLLHLIELATKAPSGGGRQYAEFIIVRNRKVKAELARLNRLAWSTYGSIWRWLARSDDKTLRDMRAVDYLVDHYEEVPAIVVACVRWNTYGPKRATGRRCAGRTRGRYEPTRSTDQA